MKLWSMVAVAVVLVFVASGLSVGFVGASSDAPPTSTSHSFGNHIAAGSRPLIPVGGPSNSQWYSENWSGYVVTGQRQSVTNVQGSWVEPSITCNSTSTYAAYWVGIDGFSDNTVEQTGTMEYCNGGVPTYYAWYEFYPGPSYLIGSMQVSPGDIISASVSRGVLSTFAVSITDLTTGYSYTTQQRVSSAQSSSAEWIVEAPYLNGILPLAKFDAVFFGTDSTGVSSTDYATVNGLTAPIGTFGTAVQEITMVSQNGTGAIRDQPSMLSTDGTSFSVAWGTSATSATSTSTSVSTTGSLTSSSSFQSTTSSSSTTGRSTSTSTTSSTSSTTATSSTSTSSSSSSSSTSSTSSSTSDSVSSSSTSSTTSTSTAPPLSVLVSTSQPSYTPGSMVSITVSVTGGSGAVSGAKVSVVVNIPGGLTDVLGGTTGSGGSVTLSFSSGIHTPAGTYTVVATVNALGYAQSTGSTSFTMR